MTQMILKLKENETVCKWCEVVQGLFFMLFPLALPLLIIAAATNHY